MRLVLLGAAAFLSACTTSAAAGPEPALSAIQSAHVRTCPPGRTQANARSGSDAQSSGVTIEDVAFTPLASDPARAVRLRRIVVAPGGVIAWHEHTALQGMALIVSGEITEFRNTCLDPLIYRPGDVAIEDANTAHGWRNLSNAPALILVSHVVVR
jgi:quercetin dioxygenase-like cupin family protein